MKVLMENKNDLPGEPQAIQPDHSRVGVTNGAKPFHVLALSGGGFRGLYTATVLKHLEEQLGAPLACRFDLICGTSAGGLLALGLAAEIPAEQLQGMFEQDGVRSCARPCLLSSGSSGTRVSRSSHVSSPRAPGRTRP